MSADLTSWLDNQPAPPPLSDTQIVKIAGLFTATTKTVNNA